MQDSQYGQHKFCNRQHPCFNIFKQINYEWKCITVVIADRVGRERVKDWYSRPSTSLLHPVAHSWTFGLLLFLVVILVLIVIFLTIVPLKVYFILVIELYLHHDFNNFSLYVTFYNIKFLSKPHKSFAKCSHSLSLLYLHGGPRPCVHAGMRATYFFSALMWPWLIILFVWFFFNNSLTLYLTRHLYSAVTLEYTGCRKR